MAKNDSRTGGAKRERASDEALGPRRAAFRRWVESNAERMRLTPTGLAKELGMTVSRLTKFMYDPAYKPTLKPDAVRRLEEHFEEPVPAETGFPSTLRRGLSEAEAVPYTFDGRDSASHLAVLSVVADSNARAPFQIRSRALELRGLAPGDIAIVDLNAAPSDGDVVCAQIYDVRRGTAQTVFRLWHRAGGLAVLTAATMDRSVEKPVVVDDDTVSVRGIVIHTVSSRRIAA